MGTETVDIRKGRIRAAIDAVLPMIDGGRFPAKCIAGAAFGVDAHCVADGHDVLRVILRWGIIDGDAQEVDMVPLGNDVWHAQFTPLSPGRYAYTVIAWVDHFDSWRHELERRTDPDDIRVALQIGSALVEQAAARAKGAQASEAGMLADWAAQMRAIGTAKYANPDANALKSSGLDATRAAVVARYADRSLASTLTLEVVADRERAGFGSWYEMFPRSASPEAGRHGTLRDVAARLPYVAQMGFDVLYLPPIHPIGRVKRKGRNNALAAAPEDVGSPWAIGAAEGGHKQIHPQLGTLDDFQELMTAAKASGIEIALDIAFQCAPDHPYVADHPQWFRHRPDGTIQFAENPPKRYEDIYPFDFECVDLSALWLELKSIFDYWIAQNVRIFRVDNPHTKTFAFWEWVIQEIKRTHPDVIFLAEAFTRPKIMHRLAKLGFSQSYTYFTWRNDKSELTQYFTELAQGPGREYFRPNVWPNTPDILHETLQSGLRSAFAARLILAATLSANYGIYGPPYELLQGSPRESGSEEYLDSEKYQLRQWDLERPESLCSLITRVNRIRRDNRALQADRSLNFCNVDNDQLIAYVKSDPGGNIVLTVVNLDPRRAQYGWVELPLDSWQIDADQAFDVHDLLSEQRYVWRGRRNYVRLDPQQAPAHIFELRRSVGRTPGLA